ncbi:MAG: hypothetical protein IBX39_10350 [Candidatus Methanoperedenaceae archaeon]|nr:hypothetical protein [Candidatus Methanoperedenaceae archaeon]
MPTDTEIIASLTEYSMFEEANEMNLKNYRRFVIQIPEEDSATAEKISAAIKNLAGIE